MFNVHPIISTTDISRNTLSVSDIKLERIRYHVENILREGRDGALQFIFNETK